MKTTITFDDKHLPVIMKALEAYERFKLGQVDYFLDIVSENDIAYEDRQELHRLVRKVCFPALENNQSYGIGNKEVGDGQIAYEISKVLDNYVSVKRNSGFWGKGTNFYEPLEYSGVPLPNVKGFKKYIDFKIDAEYYADLTKYVDGKDFLLAWKIIDNWRALSPNKELNKITGYEKAEIIRVSEVWYYRVHKPRKGLYA